MVRQHHRRYVWLNGLPLIHSCLSVYLLPPCGLRPYAYTLVMLTVLLVANSGITEPVGDTLVEYRVVNGAIPEPLTDQAGDAERGRRTVLDRDGGDCVICHAMPLPQRQFHGTVGPPLDGVGSRYTAGELRLRLVNPKAFNPQTIMPAYYKVEGLYRVLERHRGKPILTAQQVEDVVAYLLTLQAQ
jgi:L-cysteine S-thiosulfotransferase